MFSTMSMCLQQWLNFSKTSIFKHNILDNCGFTYNVPFSHFSTMVTSYKEKAMAPHSDALAWRIPWTEEPGGLPSMGSHRVGHD